MQRQRFQAAECCRVDQPCWCRSRFQAKHGRLTKPLCAVLCGCSLMLVGVVNVNIWMWEVLEAEEQAANLVRTLGICILLGGAPGVRVFSSSNPGAHSWCMQRACSGWVD